MRLVTVGGPPSAGKTSMLLHTLSHLRSEGLKSVVVKLDCLVAGDQSLYHQHGFEALTGLSTSVCPDHYLATNVDRILRWGAQLQADLLVVESAGLCHRCSPHLKGQLGVAVMDMLSGIDTPRKVGPLLRSADLVVLTRGDLVSQAEREVYRLRVAMINRKARILEVNGLTGQGTLLLAGQLRQAPSVPAETQLELRYPMPAAVCSFCLGEKRVGEQFATGNVRLMRLPEHDGPQPNEESL